MKKQSIFTLAALFLTLSLAAQELKNVDNKIMLDKTLIAEVKRKNGGFDLMNAKGESMLFCVEKSWSVSLYKTGTTDDTNIWYVFTVPGETDSTQVLLSSFYKEVSVPLFGPNYKTFAKLYHKLGFINTDGTLNKEAVGKFKARFTENISAQFVAKAAEEAKCKEGLKEMVSRDRKAEVVVQSADRVEIEPGKMDMITYEIYQDNALLGKVEVKAHPNVLKKESSEYDFFPGILSLDKDYGVADYFFMNASGCRMAWYYTRERFLFTYKDYTKTPVGNIVNTHSLKTRMEFIKALATRLVKEGYL